MFPSGLFCVVIRLGWVLKTLWSKYCFQTPPLKLQWDKKMIWFTSFSVWNEHWMFHYEPAFNYAFSNLGRNAGWTPRTPKQLAMSSSVPQLMHNTALSLLWLAFRMGKVILDRRWMKGEEFSKIYFCLNPIHLLGTRQGKLFPWHRVCLRGHVGPSGALSLLPVLLRINGSTWSPNPPLHLVPFPFLSLLFSPVLSPPFLLPPCAANGDYGPVGTMLFPMWDKQFTQERLVKPSPLFDSVSAVLQNVLILWH